jgi:O-antigen ligase
VTIGLVVRAAALLLLAGIQVVWFAHPQPWGLRAAHLAFVLLACWRPVVGLLVIAALGPVAATLAGLAHSPLTGARHLEVMVLALVAGAVLHWRAGEPTRTGRAALVFGLVALASAAAVYPTRLLTLDPDPHYFVRGLFWDPLFFGMLAAEGAALVWAVELLGRRHRGLIPGVIVAALLGHAAAAALTLRQLFEPASRSADAVMTFLELFVNVRTHSQYDVNAAASALVVVTLASVGVISRMRALVLAPALIGVLAGLWQTGSRVALVALVATAAVALGVALTRRTRREVWIGVAAIVCLVAASVAVFYAYPGRRNINIDASINSRRVLTEAGLRMVEAAPATGIGVGRFHELSGDYGSSDISRILGVSRTRDNAHNNFVQVAAELGIVGLAAFVWLLGAVLLGAVRGWRERPPAEQWMTIWLTAGVAGTMVTWLTGHPLLVPESAYVFWMCAGLAAACGDARAPATATKWGVAAIAMVVVASVPWQSEGQRDREDFEHLGSGVSLWQPDVDGQRYRIGDSRSSVFVPTGYSVALPVRLAPGSSPADVDVWVDGVRVNRLEITPDRWTNVQLSIRPARRRFVELRLEAPSDATFWIGRADARLLR